MLRETAWAPPTPPTHTGKHRARPQMELCAQGHTSLPTRQPRRGPQLFRQTFHPTVGAEQDLPAFEESGEERTFKKNRVEQK